MATSIRLSPDLSNRLDRLAAKTGRTKAFYLRQIIESGISEMEDYYLAADTLKRVRKGQEKVHSAASGKERPWPGRLSTPKPQESSFASSTKPSRGALPIFIDERVAPGEDPRRLGKALKGPLGDLWRYRVGDYRILCDIQDGTLAVLVLQIGNRREVYR